MKSKLWYKLFSTFVIVVITVISLYLFYGITIIENKEQIINTILNISPMLVITLITILMLYLFSYLKINNEKRYFQDAQFSKVINELRSQMKISKTERLSIEDKEKLYSDVKEEITKSINDDILKSIEAKYSTEVIKNVQNENLTQDIHGIQRRISEEIYNLSKRANTNLLIGIITTLIAVFILLFTILFKVSQDFSLYSVFDYYFPRLSTAIFIEVFAFFFLKMYRNNLADIKYYQNELTNIDFKLLSLKTAIYIDDKDVVKTLLLENNKIERNFILQKDETTIEVETAKHTLKNDRFFADSIKDFLESLSKMK